MVPLKFAGRPRGFRKHISLGLWAIGTVSLESSAILNPSKGTPLGNHLHDAISFLECHIGMYFLNQLAKS